MAGNRIKGITIEIEGNTQPLQAALKDVDKQAAKTAGELGEINRGLKFDQNNPVLLAQKLEVLQNAVGATSQRLDVLRTSQAQVEAQFSRGEISAEQYRAFQREIQRTESMLNNFRRQAGDVRVRIDAQADLTGIDRMRSAIRNLPEEARQAGKEIGQNLSAGAAAGVTGLGALTVGMSDTNKQLSRLESQAKAATTSVGKLGQNTKKMSDKDLKVFTESMSMKEDELSKSLDAQLSSVEGNYDRQERALDKSLDAEMSALEKAQRQKLKLIDEEYEERLKLIDEEEYKRLKAIDDQIDGIQKLGDAESKAAKEQQQKLQRTQLKIAINSADSENERLLAIKNLADFEAKVKEEALKEERDMQVESLKKQKDAIKDEFDQKRDAIKDEQELRVEKIKDQMDNEKKALSELHEIKKEQFNEEKSAYLKKIREQYATELAEFKKMNAQKVEEASKPIVVPVQTNLESANLKVGDFQGSRVIFEAVKQDTDQAVEALGNLVSAGYTTEDELTEVSKGIAGAIQLYGDAFNAEGLAESIATTTSLGEVTGQFMDLIEKRGMTVEQFNAEIQRYGTVAERANYISELLAKEGLVNVYNEFARSNPEIVKAAEAQVELTDATSEFTKALTPVITAIMGFLTSLLELANEFPGITKFVVAFLATIALIGGVLTAAGAIFGSLSAIAAAFGVTISAIAAPIGIAIVAIGALIGIAVALVSNWSGVKDFFANLWDGIVGVFEAAINTIKTAFFGIVNIIKAPLNGLIEMVNDVIKKINKIKLPDWVPGDWSSGLNIPEIPMLAKGTDYFRGGTAIVGEQGPELVQMPTGAKVIPNDRTQSMLGSVTITGNTFTVREEADITKIARKLHEMFVTEKRGR